jgi:anti-sigma B factor antagonist
MTDSRPETALHVCSEARPPTGVVVVEGDFDLDGVPAFAAAVRRHLNAGATRVEVDARRTTFADASALSALLAARRRAMAAGADFSVSATSDALDRVLDITGLRPLLCRTRLGFAGSPGRFGGRR